VLGFRRREFITLLGAAKWPLSARSQSRDQMRRVGVLMSLSPDDPERQGRLEAFLQGLEEAGWAVGRNVRIDTRWAGSDPDRFRRSGGQRYTRLDWPLAPSSEVSGKVAR
jgi:putative ABC transport system substrate-binding protein